MIENAPRSGLELMARPSSFHKVNAELERRLTSGFYLPGQRLEADPIAEEMGTSSSPVRQAFYWRVGEGLLQYNVMGGFNVPVYTERALKDMFDWQGTLAALAVSNGFASRSDANCWRILTGLDPAGDPVAEIDRFMRSIGDLHINLDAQRNVYLITAKLAPTQYVRHAAPDTLDETLTAFIQAVTRQDRDLLLSALSAYYQGTRRLLPILAEACQLVAATINK